MRGRKVRKYRLGWGGLIGVCLGVACGAAAVFGADPAIGRGAAAAPATEETMLRWRGLAEAKVDLGLYVYIRYSTTPGKAEEEKIRVVAASLLEGGTGDIALKYALGKGDSKGKNGALSWGLATNGGFTMSGKFACDAAENGKIETDGGAGAQRLIPGMEVVVGTWSTSAGKAQLCVRVESEFEWTAEIPRTTRPPVPVEITKAYLTFQSQRGSPEAARVSMWILKEAAMGRSTEIVERALPAAMAVAHDYDLREVEPLMEKMYRSAPTLQQRQNTIVGAARLGLPTATLRLALKDEDLGVARFEAAAALMHSGYGGARDVLMDGYKQHLHEVATSSRYSLGQVRTLLEKESDPELIALVQAAGREIPNGPKSGVVSSNVSTLVTKMRQNADNRTKEELWKVAEHLEVTRGAVNPYGPVFESLADQCVPADIPRLEAIIWGPDTTGQFRQFAQRRDAAVVRIRQRYWRGEE